MAPCVERPILFKGELVCALLEGRKTVTRRIIKPQPWRVADGLAWELAPHLVAVTGGTAPPELVCPYGKIGDRLYVRETWGVHWMYDDVRPSEIHRVGDGHDCTFYRADGAIVGGCTPDQCKRWRPSIHMPRKFSRIDLEIVSVRAEQLQDIEREDPGVYFDNERMLQRDLGFEREGMFPAVQMDGDFRYLWDKINGQRGPKGDPGAYTYGRDPWIWRIEWPTYSAGSAA